MRYFKITVWFVSGVKSYNVTIQNHPEFMAKLKKRKDVVKYVQENTYRYVF